jgi:thiol-disulfide isomerase/thioredoxin
VLQHFCLLKQSFAGIDLKSPSAGDEFLRATAQFIRKYPDSYISIAELESNETRWPIDTVKALFELISQKQKMSVPGQSVAAIIKGNDENTDGRKAKPIAAKNVKGEALALSDFAGKYVLLDFWGSWCVPCRESMPELKRLHQKYNSKGFEVLAIAHEYVQSDSLWKAAIEKDGTGIWPGRYATSYA